MDIKRLLRKEMPAPLWKRVLAYIVDALVLAFILSPLEPLAPSYSSFTDFFQQFTTPIYTVQFFFSVLFVLLFTLAYWSVLEYRFQQTLGKYFFSLKVISEQKELRFSQCLLRNVSKISSLLLFLDVLYMIFARTSQRYSETLAHTEVIQHV